MFRKAILTFGAGIALLAQPAIAQDDSGDEEALAMMMEMFKVEPLTAEQESRLPLAEEIVTRMIPPGSLGEMVGPMFDGMLKPLMELEREPTSANVAEQLGLGVYVFELEKQDAAEAIAILDPVWYERKKIEADMMPQLMSDMMDAMEPTMRKAMSEIYAVHFNHTELTDINNFFQTESGTSFALKSFTMASDPRILSATMESLPTIMGEVETMAARIEQATADLPMPRGYDELDAAERSRLAELVSMSEEELEATINATEDEFEGATEEQELDGDPPVAILVRDPVQD